MADNTTYTAPSQGEPGTGKAIKGTAKLEKKKPGRKIIDFLFSDQIDSIGNYLVYSILKPGLKNLLYNAIVGTAQVTLSDRNSLLPQGTYIPGQGYQSARRDPTPYSQMGAPGYGYAQMGPSAGYNYDPRFRFTDISFDTKDDAYLALERISRVLVKYQRVRVADFYEACGITGQEGNWALDQNGWYNLAGAAPKQRTDGRWMLDLPPVQPLR